MHVQVNTDKNIPGSDDLNRHVQAEVQSQVGRFSERVTRVEVHISDDNGDRTRGDDKKCVMEVRPAGLQPLSVTHVGGTVDQAVAGAAKKLERVLDSTFGRIDTPKGWRTAGPQA